MIREMTAKDINGVVELGQVIHVESEYKDIPASVIKSRSTALRFYGNPGSHIVMVGEEDGKIKGFLAGYLDTFFFGDDAVAIEMCTVVSPHYRGGTVAARLVAEFEKWAINRGAKRILMTTPERGEAFFERKGYTKVKSVMEKKL